jgi:hypothetical protein
VQLNRLLRLRVLPLVIGAPFGVTVLDLPGRIPLPSKITIRVLPGSTCVRASALTQTRRRATGW